MSIEDQPYVLIGLQFYRAEAQPITGGVCAIKTDRDPRNRDPVVAIPIESSRLPRARVGSRLPGRVER
jgi:hypothetical protein